MIPQLMLKLLGISQHRVDVAHHGNHSLGLTCALGTILDREQRVDHLVDMTTILRKIEFASCIVIIFSHCHAICSAIGPEIYSIRAISLSN